MSQLFSHTTFAPGYTSETHPGGPSTFTDNEWIDVIFGRYSFWVLSYAERLTGDPNSGFAILLLLYPYFEMVTRHRMGEVPKKRGETLEFFSEGIYEVFGVELADHPHQIQEAVAKRLYDNLRSDLAHGNLTGTGIGLSDDGTPPLWWDFDIDGTMVVGVNPRRWVERVRDHFDRYKEELLDPKNVDARGNLLKYATRNHSTT